ncbi:MAG: hypothetical protein RMK74_12860 [Myxococcales bacterium]|nr:hypothetical protein [Myxococcales bacterium]
MLASAHRAGWTVLTGAVGSPSGVRIHLGFMARDPRENASPEVFERILRGLLPGLKVDFVEGESLESFLSGKVHGGLVAGVPPLQIDEERQRFSLASVLRSMHGRSYALLFVARPVEEERVGEQLRHLWRVRDACHARPAELGPSSPGRG